MWNKIAKKYQEQLSYFASLTLEEQYKYGSDIVSNVERYRSVVDLLLINQDKDMIEEKAEEFNQYLNKFYRLYSEDEEYNSQDIMEEQESEMSKEIPDSLKPLDTIEKIIE